MDDDARDGTGKACVVVFPSSFARKRMPLLMRNIRGILGIKNQRYGSVRRDGGVIVIDADDPVFASSAVNMLFGIRRTAIAKRAGNGFDAAVSEISRTGRSLLLGGERFFVQVEGSASGYTTKDLELAATSSIIEGSSGAARPGTEHDHDRLLYAFLTRSSAYVCIFSDDGLGGIPYGSHKNTVLCAVFDELSAVSCMETIKQGFRVRIIVCYRKDSELSHMARMISRIIPRTVSERVELGFFRVGAVRGGYAAYLRTVLGVTGEAAAKYGLDHVSLPLTPLIMDSELIDACLLEFAGQKITAYTPLGALEDEIYRNAREVGMGKYVSRIERLAVAGSTGAPDSRAVRAALGTLRSVSVRPGPNNVHEILDALGEETT